MPIADYRLGDLLALAVTAAEVNDPRRIAEESEKLYDRYSARIFGESASILAKAWLNFTLELMQLYMQYNLYNDRGHCDYYFHRLMGSDMVLSRFDAPRVETQTVTDIPIDPYDAYRRQQLEMIDGDSARTPNGI